MGKQFYIQSCSKKKKKKKKKMHNAKERWILTHRVDKTFKSVEKSSGSQLWKVEKVLTEETKY